MKTWPLVFLVLVFAGGCYTRHIRKFEQSKGAETFENWRIYVHLNADMYHGRTYAPDNHNYKVNCMAWTVDGDVSHGPSSFRTSAYFARFDSLKLAYSRGHDVVQLPLDSLHRGEWNDSSRTVNLEQRDLVAIPAEVQELRATLTITFTEKKTGKMETKVFEIKMIKREGREFVPLTV